MKTWQLQLTIVGLASAALVLVSTQGSERQWLPGDSHIHSQWSPDYDETRTPPEPIKGADGRYSTPMNARKAREYGLAWMVTTDHGGPDHAKFNLAQAYVELQASRQLEPSLLQFYGMELNMPGMDHHTLIIPNGGEESSVLYEIEHQFDSQEAWPRDPARNSEAQAQRALEHMKRLAAPAVAVRQPSIAIGHAASASPGSTSRVSSAPTTISAPEVYRGMEGAPGHQAGGLAPDGRAKVSADGRPAGFRGAYGNPGAYTMGGFDQMTAIVGGLWDSMLGEGRRFWVLATSDSHVNYAESVRPGLGFLAGPVSENLRARRAQLRRRHRRTAQRAHLRRGRRSHQPARRRSDEPAADPPASEARCASSETAMSLSPSVSAIRTAATRTATTRPFRGWI